MEHLLHDVPHSIWHVDKGIFHTLRELLLRPGPTLLGYLRGQRARHFQPLSLLLLVTGVASFLAIKMRLGVIALTLSSGTSTELREAQANGAESVMHYMGWIYVAVSPLVGWFVRRALRRTGLNLAEAMVIVLYITAASNFLSLFVLPFYHLVTTSGAYYRMSSCSSLLLVTYQGWAYGQVLASTSLSAFGRWWRGLLTAVATYLLVMCGALILMFALNWTNFKTALRHEMQHRQALRATNPPTAPGAR